MIAFTYEPRRGRRRRFGRRPRDPRVPPARGARAPREVVVRVPAEGDLADDVVPVLGVVAVAARRDGREVAGRPFSDHAAGRREAVAAALDDPRRVLELRRRVEGDARVRVVGRAALGEEAHLARRLHVTLEVDRADVRVVGQLAEVHVARQLERQHGPKSRTRRLEIVGAGTRGDAREDDGAVGVEVEDDAVVVHQFHLAHVVDDDARVPDVAVVLQNIDARVVAPRAVPGVVCQPRVPPDGPPVAEHREPPRHGVHALEGADREPHLDLRAPRASRRAARARGGAPRRAAGRGRCSWPGQGARPCRRRTGRRGPRRRSTSSGSSAPPPKTRRRETRGRSPVMPPFRIDR